MLTRNLEMTLHRALRLAHERHHEYCTLEHLLTALTEDQDVMPVLRACNVNVKQLRAQLFNFLDKDLSVLATAEVGDPEPTIGFRRVVQSAAIHVQSLGRSDVTGANVLKALFSETLSHAVHFLQVLGMTRLDAVNYIAHGITKPPTEHPVDAPVKPGPRLRAAGKIATSRTSASGPPMANVDETQRSKVPRPQADRLQAIIAERQKARYLRGISDPR